VASTAANTADGLATTGAPLLVVATTTEPFALSTLNALWFLPWLVLGLVVGVLVDRTDRRRAMIWAAVTRAGLAGVLAVAIASGKGHLALLYGVVLLFSTAEIVYDTASRALLPALVPVERLEAANSRLVSADLVAQGFVGPLLAGLLFGLAAGWPFAAIALLLVVAAVAMTRVRAPASEDRPASGDAGDGDGDVTSARRSIRAEVREGTRFLFGHPVLRTIALFVGVLGFLGSAVTGLVVLYAADTLALGDGMVGVLLAVAAVGSVVGSAVAARARRRWGAGRALAASIGLIGASAIGLGVTRATPVAMVLLAVGSAGTMAWNVVTMALRQALIPGPLLGRVFSAYRLLALGSVPLGATAAGAAASVTDVPTTFLVAGVLHLVVAIAFARPLAAAGRACDEALRPAVTAQQPTDDPAEEAGVVPVSG
jgi:MFS family permease